MRVPTLQSGVPIVDDGGRPTAWFVQWWGNSLAQVVKSANEAAAIANVSFVTINPESVLNAERVLTPFAGDLVGTDGGTAYTLGLANTAVVPGAYGNSRTFVTVTVDAKGRVTGAAAFPLATRAKGRFVYG